MKSLEDFNTERREVYRQLNDNSPRLNGIACPKCKAELYDSSPNMILSSNPPQTNVHCSKCKYRGYRII